MKCRNTPSIVFTIGVREDVGATATSEFHLDFTIFSVVDNVPGTPDADGDIADVLDIDVPFYLVDAGRHRDHAVPSGSLTFHDVDDVPHLGSIGWQYDGQIRPVWRKFRPMGSGH